MVCPWVLFICTGKPRYLRLLWSRRAIWMNGAYQTLAVLVFRVGGHWSHDFSLVAIKALCLYWVNSYFSPKVYKRLFRTILAHHETWGNELKLSRLLWMPFNTRRDPPSLCNRFKFQYCVPDRRFCWLGNVDQERWNSAHDLIFVYIQF